MAQLSKSPKFYKLRLVLACISPMKWRRLLISSEISIAQLPEHIQVANWPAAPGRQGAAA
jgi:hypothetical protein